MGNDFLGADLFSTEAAASCLRECSLKSLIVNLFYRSLSGRFMMSRKTDDEEANNWKKLNV